ncbi:unnamed protein product [Caenorhabditis sp. 36 PRJEB53466]|nr:unnamed protein product [Caenorhabditis sp. 36 PRJEB53466]
MHRSLAALYLLLVAVPHASAFLFGGGCCSAPIISSPCCGGATSWAYAPPQIIGYERIPLYAKVPMPPPPPPPSYVQPPPTGYVSQPVAPQGYSYQPQQPIGGPVEQGIEVSPDQISSGYQPQQLSSAGNSAIPTSDFGSQSSSGLIDSSVGSLQSAVSNTASNAAFEAAGIAPSARRLRKFKN